MSTLVQNVAKVKSAHAALSASIEAKGVSVPAGTKLTGMPALVDQIQTGGGGEGGYLTFTAVEATTLKLDKSGSLKPLSLLKSTDGKNWTKWENPSTNGIQLQAGESVYLKADEDAPPCTATGDYDYNYFSSTGAITCTGDPVSLLKLVAPFDYKCCFASLFIDCTSLTKAPELPSMTLSQFCYAYMFWNCTSLTKAPELPSTTLSEFCYDYMFNGCTSLTSAPKLPAMTLSQFCYAYMFNGCTSLTQAPELPATSLTNGCYSNMFNGCTSLKRIKMNASLKDWGIYMFKGCTSLELVDMTGSTGVPQLSNVNNFANTNDTYKIVVPDSLYDEWIAETNWASIASHIMKKSDWNAAHPDDQL